jgi:amino acid adenylation domain-containing protein
MLIGSMAPGNRTGFPVHRLFEEHARRQADAPAVRCGPVQLTYRELDRRADLAARVLLGAGLQPGRLVAVAMDRTVDAVVAILGILKAGGAYVPIDPMGPDALLRQLLSDADPFGVLTHERHRARVTDGPGRLVMCLDTFGWGADDGTVVARTSVAGDALACVIYTSGTTGAPNGAMIGHANLVSAFFAWEEVYQLAATDRHLQIASLEFDVFTADWVRALCSGALLVMTERNFMHDRTAQIAELHRVIVDERVTVMECNVRTLRLLQEHLGPSGPPLGSLRLLAVGTDRWHVDEHIAVQKRLGTGLRHVNTYGVVEATIDSTYFELTHVTDEIEHPERLSLIGVPFPGTRIHILAEDGTPCPVDVAGEICVAGAGVGLGYWNRSVAAGERYRDVDVSVDLGGRVVRTGDLGRIRSDGIVEFICRAGELGGQGGGEPGLTAIQIAEVELTLRGHPGIRDVAVVTADDGATLVGYLVVDGGEVIDGHAVRSFLAGQVPDRLIPATVVLLDTLPRTRAGKIDRRGLPRRALVESSDSQTGPTSFGAAKSAFGAAGPRSPEDPAETGGWAIWTFFTAVFGTAAWCATGTLWPGSTDVSAVADPWATLFQILYLFEALSFGLGMTVLVLGRTLVARLRRRRGWATAAHLAVSWLLIAWWPQDNFYRLIGKYDMPRQAAMVYAFNITLMIAAAVVVRFMISMLAQTVRADRAETASERDG